MTTVRTFAFALTVMAFVVISSYVYLNTQNNVSPTLSNQNQSSTTFIQPQISTQSVPAAPAVSYFGNHNFEPPSAILIPANTMVWTNFKLDENSNSLVAGSIVFFPFPNVIGANITVAIYFNGYLNASSTTPVADENYGVNASLIPSSESPNSVFALTGLTPTTGVGTQTSSALSLNGTITIAIISSRSIWLAGWTETDMSKGSGPQYGQSTGQLAGTYEVPESGTYLPPSLPSATITLSFELQISGDLMA
ncbi:MAG: hypothetical protein ACREBQ_04245 [Nitrososphaerales archaeon]